MKTDRTKFDNATEAFVDEANAILLDTTREMEELRESGGNTAEITEFQIKVNEALTAINLIPDTEEEVEGLEEEETDQAAETQPASGETDTASG